MSDVAAAAPPVARTYGFAFRGTGGEYFGIWIVNLALTVLTLGIYGAWATVRTRRYFRGNTFLADHSFEYHASPLRILIGRLIAVALLLGYNISVAFDLRALIVWVPLFFFAVPWLIVSSLRFNARNTSYRNVRFNFVGTYGGAFKAYILWPIAGVLTFGVLMPLARKKRDYFFVNNHTFGGKHFETEFSAWRIFLIYLIAFGVFMLVFVAIGAAMGGFFAVIHPPAKGAEPPPAFIAMFFLLAVVAEIGVIGLGIAVTTAVFNMVINRTAIDGRHKLKSRISPMGMAWIVLTNVLLTMLSMGIYYPWAQIRQERYRVNRLALEATTDLDEFTSEAFGTQSAVGEEIAGFFDLGIGL